MIRRRARWQMSVSYSSGIPNDSQPSYTFRKRRAARRAKAALCEDLGINPDNVTIAPLQADGAVAA